MTKITFREPSGTEHVREVEDGLSVMRAAVETDVPGIKAECGGAAACATCQVRITPEWLDRVPAAEDLELSMLDDEDVEAHIRLSCQIQVTPALDGLVVDLPF